MNKELIERSVAATAEEMDSFDNCGPGPGIHFFEPDELTEFATRFLARIDAERGKEAVAECDREGRLKFTSPNGFINSGDCPHWVQVGTRLFASPTIPEGMVLVPIDPTLEMALALHGGATSMGWFEHAKDKYAALIAAAQGERNAD